MFHYQSHTVIWDHCPHCSRPLQHLTCLHYFKLKKWRHNIHVLVRIMGARSSIINSLLGWLPAPLMVTLFRLKCKQQEGCFLYWKILWPTAWEKLWWPPLFLKPAPVTTESHYFKCWCTWMHLVWPTKRHEINFTVSHFSAFGHENQKSPHTVLTLHAVVYRTLH